ncbi:MAG: hypothetical protein JWO46_692 [Nocardioidaceae bacterium]|nr:hypothetical protein [Nocardioidaceae bacterium]
MRTSTRHAGVALLSAVFLVGLSGCGGDDSSTDSSTGSSDGGSSESASSDAGGSDDADDADAPAGGAVFVDTSGSPAATVSITDDGFDPADTSVSVGDVVTFTAPGGGVFGVIVSDIEGKTVTEGLDESFRFDKPGSYPVKEDVSGATATITVR